MSKLTAQKFAELPEELQQEILKQVPVEHLNDIRIIQPKDVNADELTHKLQNMLLNLSRKECLTIIVELMKMVGEGRFDPEMPPELKLAADVELLSQVIDHAKMLIDKAGLDFGEGE